MIAKARGPEGTNKNAVTQPQNNTAQLAIIVRFENRAFKGSTRRLLDPIKPIPINNIPILEPVAP
jgi:hypothetical protein